MWLKNNSLQLFIFEVYTLFLIRTFYVFSWHICHFYGISLVLFVSFYSLLCHAVLHCAVTSNSLWPRGHMGSLFSASVHGDSPGRNTGVDCHVLDPWSRGSSQLRDWTQVSRIAGEFFTAWATREAQEYWSE